ncbi:TonB-dependent receptor domain-containing protein [Novosphingobium sp. JCM 18896]|uniref:TonB-dependent receptor domain-containing protein n=1 Tax=Novosphingobium sp. JCM 18896 TaxID=2989731 RepID=UPI0022220E03|nr:TonB-dependent receptor [Novosphingobium sp. JCM 18896]MCW1427759.1 TonB-dependent receptor [Novosphingobium sp. JCM 18896]
MSIEVSRRSFRRVAWLAAFAPACATPALAAGEAPIVVTGSRIPRAPAESAEPIDATLREYLDDRGLTNLADALNETPGVRGSVTLGGDQAVYGQGVNFINLYGLGSNRTLVLVNGRRVVSSNVPSVLGNATPGTQVDFNVVPTILLDRVERVSIGGAPVYGTDAIAGTVNVVLKRRLTGLETRATSGVSGQGDNVRWNLAAAGGIDFAGGRGNLTAALSYDRLGAVTGGQRGIYRANLGNATNPCTVVQAGVCSALNLVAALGPAGRSPTNDGRINPSIGFNDSLSDGFPGSVLIRDLNLPAVSRGGVLSSGAGAYAWQFAPDGQLRAFDKGTIYGAPVPGVLAAAAMASGGDGLRLNDYLALTSSLRRLNASLSFTYDLTDRLTLFADGLFYHGRADLPVKLPTFNAVQFGGGSAPLTFRTDNPFLTTQARQQLAALGYGSTFQLSRANADLADTSGRSDSKIYRGVVGLEGKLALGGRDYGFEVSLNYGRSDFTDYGQAIDQQRFVNAVNVARVGGQIVCSTTPTVTGFPAGQAPIADPACVPLNLFGEGAASPAARAYVLRDTIARSRLEQVVVNANLGGSPFDLFGNPVSFNLGFEHHEEKASFSPDAFLQAGLGRAAAAAPTAGRYDLDEVFGEVLVPLIAPENDSVFHSLSAFGRVRHVDNSANGRFTAWAAGGSFAPIADLELRGNFTRSFRAPAITELYSPRAVTNIPVPDLCSTANIGAGPVPEIRRANCTAFLARYPNATPLIAATVTVPTFNGGNPGLRNERSDNLTWGALLRPRFLPGLSLAADYIRVRISDPIANLSMTQVAQGCFDNAEFNASDPARGNAFCALIGRDAQGQVVSDAQNPAVTLGYVNGKRIEMSGVQAGLEYRTDLSGLGLAGALELGGDLFHLRRRLVDVTGVAPARSDGVVGDPRWQGQLRLRYANAAWGLATNVNYTGGRAIALTGRGDAPNDTREFDHFDPFATVDAALFVTAAESYKLTLSITNLFDRVGQKYFGYVVPLSINDALGRRFALSVSRTW